MILEIDVGNTRIKWRLLNKEQARIAGGADDEAGFLRDLGNRFGPVSEVRIGCVAQPEIADELCQLIDELWDIKPWLAKTQKHHAGLEVAYNDPSRLGVDRWLAMLAAYNQEGGAVCVVDCGSAITVDLVDKDGHQLGGYIVPGVELQKTTLLKSTGQIRLEESAKDCHVSWGRSTEEAVNFGVLRQSSSFINAIVAELLALGHPPTFYITGGDAQMLLPMIDAAEQFVYRAELVMDGLALAATY